MDKYRRYGLKYYNGLKYYKVVGNVYYHTITDCDIYSIYQDTFLKYGYDYLINDYYFVIHYSNFEKLDNDLLLIDRMRKLGGIGYV